MDVCIICPQCKNQNIYHIFEQDQEITIDFICNHCNIGFRHTIVPVNVIQNDVNEKTPICLPLCIPIPCCIL